MRPELFQIPWIHYGVKGYGFALMIGFLTGIYFAARRAARVRGNPDLILNLGFIALIFGVVGARAFYVAHYWNRDFAGRSLFNIINVTAGGLEFYGGFVAAMVFIIWYVAAHGKPAVARTLALAWIAMIVAAIIGLNVAIKATPPKSYALAGGTALVGFFIVRALWRWSAVAGVGQPVSLRLYLDIVTPSLIWGLAFGRIGCFLNGCCWGATCTNPHLPWAVEFPFGSPSQVDQWSSRLTSVPAPLIHIDERTGRAEPLHRDLIALDPGTEEAAKRRLMTVKSELDALQKQGASESAINKKMRAWNAQQKAYAELDSLLRPLKDNLALYGKTQAELVALAHRSGAISLPVHPTQLYACVNALLLSGLLSAVFYRRKRHGIVFGLMWLLYPISRFILEAIRTDNPLDTFGLTISQRVSLAGFAAGIVWLLAMWRLPLRSPRAVAYEPPPEPPPREKKPKNK